MGFLETVMAEYNAMRARSFADDGYEGVTVAGIAILALDTRKVLLAQRSMDETDDPGVQETWEFPGGHLSEGEEPYVAAVREYGEETGLELPDDAMVSGGWRSEDGHYQCFVVTVANEFPLDGWTPTSEVQAVDWFDREMIEGLDNLRPEVRDQTDWDYVFAGGEVSRNKENAMTEASTEPEFDPLAFAEGPIPVHGVLAPEEVETGDQRGFNAGSLTTRPLRLPFSWQKVSIGGHDGSVVVGSVDRLMRKDGMIHWEGMLMPSEETDEFCGMLAFFSKFGVSVDGDKGSLDREKSIETGVMWFDAVRASGLTAVSIPAFHEAYVRFGYHPDMPEETLAASIDMVGGRETFDRGPGWVTNPRETKNIHDYWTKKGEEGYAKVGWGTPGDFRRAKALIGAKIAQHSPSKVKYLNQIIAQWHFDALGYWPGELGKPGNAPNTPENRRRAATHAALVEKVAEQRDDIEAVSEGEGTAEWEAVLVSSVSGNRVRPPLSYFHEYTGEDGAINIFDPDDNGFVRVTGYAAEWGVCHIGFNGRCVEPPQSYSDDYPGFHKGRTKTDEGYIQTGVLTYGVGHRDAQTILKESADEAFFDNLKNAWAAVRVGENDRGIWFSGVVLPTVPEEDIIAIEASGQVSGEWLHNEMRACLTVNVRGFEVERPSAEYDEDGNVIALAASAFNALSPTHGECPPTAAERMEALRTIDAEIRFAALREQFLAERA
jgi:8-oxo-dGTP pyrophosphatase MutT (NUDIX family)